LFFSTEKTDIPLDKTAFMEQNKEKFLKGKQLC